jgi:hypothetical protein
MLSSNLHTILFQFLNSPSSSSLQLSKQLHTPEPPDKMQFSTAIITALLALTVTAAPQAGAIPNAGEIAALVPDFGVQPSQGNDGAGNCVTPVAPAKIPCTCPPARDQYLAQLTAAVQAGNTFGLPAPFPTGTDNASQIARFQTMLSVMQNINGAKGRGCPAISTTFKQSLDALTGAPA